jgi:Zn-dependent alcohol dehydrogenase
MAPSTPPNCPQQVGGGRRHAHAHTGTRAPQVPELVTEYMQGNTMLDKYVTHNLKFDQINEAFELLHSGQCLRCVLTF